MALPPQFLAMLQQTHRSFVLFLTTLLLRLLDATKEDNGTSSKEQQTI
jgi:hypothetical protein